jgi:hypothetical protein
LSILSPTFNKQRYFSLTARYRAQLSYERREFRYLGLIVLAYKSLHVLPVQLRGWSRSGPVLVSEKVTVQLHIGCRRSPVPAVVEYQYSYLSRVIGL